MRPSTPMSHSLRSPSRRTRLACAGRPGRDRSTLARALRWPASAASPCRPGPPAAGAPSPGALDERIEQAVARVTPEIVQIRHRIHQNPELGNRETETAALVAERLRALGLDVETGIAHTGVVGVLEGGRPGPVVAVRADMDALPVTEETDFPFASTKTTDYLGQEVGVAHACGHDVHTSVGLGVASALAAMRDELPGTVVFLFQPAEEGPPPGEEGGAKLMLDEGVFERFRPDAIFALHSFPDLEVGQVGVNPGPTMASVDHFVATILGKQAHGAYPTLSIDPVVMAAQAVTALQTIRSRNLPAHEPSVVTVGIIRGGERFNIIPGKVQLEGTVRTYEPGDPGDDRAPHGRDPGRRHPGRRRLVQARLPEQRAGDDQRPGADRPGAREPRADARRRQRGHARADHGGRGLRLLRPRGPGGLLPPRRGRAGHDERGDPHPDLPRRRQRDRGRHAGDGHLVVDSLTEGP